MAILAIFFDYDGVLTIDATGSFTLCNYLNKLTGIKIELISNTYSKYNRELTLGKLSHSQIWPEFCKKLNIELDQKTLEDAFKSTPINQSMFDLAKKLKTNYKIGIITDNKKDRIDFLKRHQNLDGVFEPIVVSSEIGSDKSDSKIFIQATELLGLKPENCVFIDNHRKNLIIPESLGMKTIWHNHEVNDLLYLENKLKEHDVNV